jgi:hypothetical protein
LQGHVARLGYKGEVLGDENSTHHKTALKITYDKEYPLKYCSFITCHRILIITCEKRNMYKVWQKNSETEHLGTHEVLCASVVVKCGLENRDYCHRGSADWPCNSLLSPKVGTNFADKRQTVVAMKQRVSIKFCFKMGKILLKFSSWWNMLVFTVLSHTQVSEWCKRFWKLKKN